MLYAARAALSERDRLARSHAGTWALFREEFVLTGEFEADLAQAAQCAQARRRGPLPIRHDRGREGTQEVPRRAEPCGSTPSAADASRAASAGTLAPSQALRAAADRHGKEGVAGSSPAEGL
jgi:hypothetical protein